MATGGMPLIPYIYIPKNEIRGAHAFEGVEPLTALNSRSSVLRGGSGAWERTDLEKPIFLPLTFAVGVGERDPGVNGPTSQKHPRDRGPGRGGVSLG